MSGPHDLFVRSTFGHPERAAAELRVALPSHVVAQVDWDTLRQEPGMVIRYLLYIGNSSAREATRQVLHSVVDAQRAEELMRSYGEELIEQGRQQGLQQGLARGQAKGHAESVLRLLAARGVPVTEEARQHILTCTDVATLDRWFDRALTASTLADVLAEPSR